jgi:flagellar biosynthetic protein FliQ
MTVDFVMELWRQCFIGALLFAGPILAVSLLVGVAIGLFQAATQVHEMSLVFVPKIILVALVVTIFGHWQWGLLVQFASRLLTGLPQMAR